MAEVSGSRILIVDDDAQLLRDVQAHLEKQGYAVAIAETGVDALALAKTMAPDLVILDITFPEVKTSAKRVIDGIEVLRLMRADDNVPVIMLSATNISSVKVMALTLGADDYMSKPVDLQELTARIEAILRRSREALPAWGVMVFNRLTLNTGERRVWKDGVLVELTSVEFDILYTLARRPKHVFTRDKLLELAWKEASYSIAKVIDVHIGHIRKKIEDDPARPALIVTVRGTGYRFEDVPA